MTERHPFVKWLRRKDACGGGIDHVKRYASPEEWWGKNQIPPYAAWLLIMLNNPDAQKWRGVPRERWVILGIKIHNLGTRYDGPPLQEIRKRYPHCPWKRDSPMTPWYLCSHYK